MKYSTILSQSNFMIVNKTLAKKMGLINSIIVSNLCSLDDKYGNGFFFSQEEMADTCCICLDTLKKGLSYLKKEGFIKIEKKGLPCKNYYYFTEIFEKYIDNLLSEEVSNNKDDNNSNKLDDFSTNKKMDNNTNNINNTINNTNNKESTKVDKKENNKFDFKKSLLDMGVEEQVVLDWLAVRKNKKASNTETALKSLKKQIELTNASPNECIKMAAENSWQGFKAKWYLNEINSIGSPSNVAAIDDQYKSDNEDYAKFRNWMKENCPSCDDPTNFSGSRITEQEFFKLKEIYSGKDIADVIMAIENRKDLRGKYASLYITVCTWLKNRK